MRRFSLASLVAAALIAANAASAGAAVKVGETFTPEGTWGGTGVMIQVGVPGDINVVPTAGVLTSWSFEATAIEPTPPLKMKVVRHAGGDDFTTVADSQLETPMQGVLNTWPTRIPVNAGDLLALFFSDDTYGYGNPPDPQYVTQEISGPTGTSVDPPPGATTTYESPSTGQRADVSAMFEADADHDGFGDESQDKCVGTPGTANGCPSTVTIDKLKQKGDTKVKVTATVPGAGTLKVGSSSDPTLASAAAKKSLKAVTTTLTATTKQQLKLTLKLTKSAIGKLADTGQLKLKVKAVYTPVGGPAGSQTKKKKLKT